jgi:hypothetical protein
MSLDDFLSLCRGISQVSCVAENDVEGNASGKIVFARIRRQYHAIYKVLMKLARQLNSADQNKKVIIKKIRKLNNRYNYIYDVVLQLQSFFPGKLPDHILPLKIYGDAIHLKAILRMTKIPEEKIIKIFLEKILIDKDSDTFMCYTNFFGAIFLSVAQNHPNLTMRMKNYIDGIFSSKDDFDRMSVFCKCGNIEMVRAYLQLKNFQVDEISEFMQITTNSFQDDGRKSYNEILTVLTKKYYSLNE